MIHGDAIMKFLYLLFLMPFIVSCGSSNGTSPFTENGGAIGTGIATQRGVSVGLSPINPEGWDFNNIESVISVTLSDKNNFPVPNGTIVNFRSEPGGQIQPTCTIDGTVGTDPTPGQCSITWFSNGERPDDGLVSVLVYTAGSESYTDLNGNGLYDGPTVDFFDVANDDLPEAFIDANNNGTYDPDEVFIDFNNNQQYDVADGLYNGNDCVGDSTVCGNSTINVFENRIITLSGSFIGSISSAPSPIIITADGSVGAFITITDVNGNSLPFETTIDLSVSDGSIDPTSFTVGNGGNTVFFVTITGVTTTADINATLTANSTTPTESTSTAFLNYTILAP